MASDAEIKIWRKVQHEFLVEDAQKQVREFFGEDGVPDWIDHGDYEYLVERFIDEFDCNVAENKRWHDLIKEEVSSHVD